MCVMSLDCGTAGNTPWLLKVEGQSSSRGFDGTRSSDDQGPPRAAGIMSVQSDAGIVASA